MPPFHSATPELLQLLNSFPTRASSVAITNRRFSFPCSACITRKCSSASGRLTLGQWPTDCSSSKPSSSIVCHSLAVRSKLSCFSFEQICRKNLRRTKVVKVNPMANGPGPTNSQKTGRSEWAAINRPRSRNIRTKLKELMSLSVQSLSLRLCERPALLVRALVEDRARDGERRSGRGKQSLDPLAPVWKTCERFFLARSSSR
jgi:hypothetical protein